MLRRFVIVLAVAAAGGVLAQEPTPPLPSFEQLEAEGATIGEVRVLNQDIFDTDDPKEDNALFRAANALHIKTRVGVIRRALLFKSGDRVSVPLIEETERLLRNTRYLYDVHLRPVAYRDGVVDIEVATRDSWTLDPGFSVGRSGGANTGGINLREYNLLGTGTSVSLSRSKDIDRTSNEFQISNDNVFRNWTGVSYRRASTSDGSRESAAVVRPFYALDARWAAGVRAARDDRIDAIYNAGVIASEYRTRERLAEVFGGWSRGRDDGWVRRYSLGVSLVEDAYSLEPGRVAPAQLPPDDKLVTPFVRFELLEDRYEKVNNRNQIGRPEFFALGLASTVQIGRATTGLGSSRDAWVYSASASRGFETVPEHLLYARAAVSGQYADGRVSRQQLGGSAQYYLPHHRRWLFYASVSADVLTNPVAGDNLLLGGDNGLRGYPLRYQSGDRRALLTLEERFHTDVFPFRLFRIGGAAFLDYGRAWGGDNRNLVNPGWLADVGFGLRIFSVRAAFSNVLHLDIAFPLDPDADIKKVQYLVKTKASF